MRWPWLIALVAAAAACHAPPRMPEAPGQFVVDPHHAALPPYGGTVWSAPCTATLGIAPVAERNARRAAIETWFLGSDVELTPLGDRARVVYLPARGRAPHRRRDAEALARHVAELAAPLFGLEPGVHNTRLVDTKTAWIVDVELRTKEFTRAPLEDAVALVVRIDRASGDLLVGLVGEVVPRIPACEHEPIIDAARAKAAAFAGGVPTELMVDKSVTARAADYGHSSRGLIEVYSREEVISIDPVTYAVVDRYRPDRHEYDAMGIGLDPVHDMRHALGTWLRRYRHH